jgi:hypothetical protein
VSPHWNAYVPVADDRTSVLAYQGAGTATPTGHASAPSDTPRMRSALGNFASVFLPFGIAAAFLAPAPDIRRRVRTSSATMAPFIIFDQLFEDDWQIVRELVTPADVEELQRLWALPYGGPVQFDFRLPE